MSAMLVGSSRVMRAVRRLLFWTHLSVAVTAGIVIIIMSATGVALAYQRQLLARVAEQHRVAPPAPNAQRLALDSIAARIITPPDTATVASVTLSADSTLPLTIGLSDRSSVFVDPYTARVLGSDSEMRGRFQAIERWHRSVAIGTGMRSKAGTMVTGACNLAFLFLVLSGFYLWWPRRWSPRAFAAVLLFNRRATGHRRDWNWHHVLGFWAMPALLLIVASATFMSYAWPQALVARAYGVAPAAHGGSNGPRNGERARRSGREQRSVTAASRASLDSLVAHAASRGEWTSLQLRLPQRGAKTATVSLTRGTMSRPDRRVQLTLDASTAAVVQQQRYADNDPARRFRSWIRPIHTGEAGGFLGQTIAALASAAAVVLGLTGFSLAIRRAARALRRRGESRAPVPAFSASVPQSAFEFPYVGSTGAAAREHRSRTQSGVSFDR